MTSIILSATLALLLLFPAQVFLAQGTHRHDAQENESVPATNAFVSPEDVAVGREYFHAHCAGCHGPEGEGGRGINLTIGQYRNGSSDRGLFRTISNGIPGTEMPATPLPSEELWKIVAYVRHLGQAGAKEKASGDANAGRAIFEGKGACSNCHSVNRQGGILGPDLTSVGLKRSLSFLRESLIHPDADVAPDYEAVAVITTAGERISGIRLNEDDYSVQIRDMQGNLRSFLKKDLKEVQQWGSLMPSYSSGFSSEEINNLVAYLSSLRGEP